MLAHFAAINAEAAKAKQRPRRSADGAAALPLHNGEEALTHVAAAAPRSRRGLTEEG
eukprot:gene2639-47719_t